MRHTSFLNRPSSVAAAAAAAGRRRVNTRASSPLSSGAASSPTAAAQIPHMSLTTKNSRHVTAAGKRAAEELAVYVRAMKAAQRRWARAIDTQESNVRRLMLEEEHLRDKLEALVLRGTRERIKYLTNTDLMAVSQLVSPPSVEVFRTYAIPAEQISGFSVYVMGCMGADPNRLDVPLPVLLADLSSAWAVLPPTKKDAFRELADIFKSHVPSRADMEAAAAATAASSNSKLTVTDGRLKKKESKAKHSDNSTKASRNGNARTDRQQEPHCSGKQEKATVAPRHQRPVPPATTFSSPFTQACARQQQQSQQPGFVLSAQQRLRARRVAPLSRGGRRTADAVTTKEKKTKVSASPEKMAKAAALRTAAAMAAAPSATTTASTTVSTAAATEATAPIRNVKPQSFLGLPPPPPPPHVVQFETDGMEELARQLPPAEYAAFCTFAEESLREMEIALDAELIPINKKGTPSKLMRQKERRSRGGRRAVAAHSPLLPRGVRLFIREWLPIAAEEWLRKTRRQKSLYMPKQ